MFCVLAVFRSFFTALFCLRVSIVWSKVCAMSIYRERGIFHFNNSTGFFTIFSVDSSCPLVNMRCFNN